MFLIALATDYDGTLAHDGRVEPATIAALERLKASGRKLLMVTGRELPDLKRVFDRLDLFDLVVAENGALLYAPESREETLVGPAPPPALVAAIQAHGVKPLSIGCGIIATWEPNEAAVLQAIHEAGVEWQIIFNKGAVMVLPPGVNKASGLAAGLERMKLSPLNVVGVGDAENDQAFLSVCGCSVAVANALGAVKASADLVTKADHGAGVAETIDILLADPARLVRRAAARRLVRIADTDEATTLSPADGGVLIAGSSGLGKSTLATAIIEKLVGQDFQLAVIDPEGDYDSLEPSVVIGDARHEPLTPEALSLLETPNAPPVVVNLLGLPIADRPDFFRGFLAEIRELRARTGRPHWLVIDEAHHMLPAIPASVVEAEPLDIIPTVYVTVHPDQLTPAALDGLAVILAVGPQAKDVIESFCRATHRAAPQVPVAPAEEAVLFWKPAGKHPPRWIEADRPVQDRKRHLRKYAAGALGEDKSFYFRGPDETLNLRAQNLLIFLQLADGVDDATWLHHLRRGDYTRWFYNAIKDEDLAMEAKGLERDKDPAESRTRMRELIERRYTAPAGAPA